MCEIVSQREVIPVAYPVLNPAVPDEVWQRVEKYISWRWSPREVFWIVRGPGEFVPSLAPATITKVEIWTTDGWQEMENSPTPSPLGRFYLLNCQYRFSATVGNDVTVPAIVAQACQRLAAYFAQKQGAAGMRMERLRAGSIEIQRMRDPNWSAQSMQNSGAADLLRSYRSVYNGIA